MTFFTKFHIQSAHLQTTHKYFIKFIFDVQITKQTTKQITKQITKQTTKQTTKQITKQTETILLCGDHFHVCCVCWRKCRSYTKIDKSTGLCWECDEKVIVPLITLILVHKENHYATMPKDIVNIVLKYL